MAHVEGPLGCTIKNQYLEEMIATAKRMATTGKGLLASDGSDANLGRKFATIGLENNVVNRRRYREMLYTTPGIGEYLSGIIFNDEIFWSKVGGRSDGQRLVDIVTSQGILVGIKTDLNVRDLPYKSGENFTAGIDGMSSRAARYYANGARFAKLRVVFTIQNGYISDTALLENCVLSSKYALIYQSNGLVPIVEPELMMTGNHSLAVCKYWSGKILAKMYKTLSDYDVALKATILKPNMVSPGNEYNVNGRSLKENAIATIDVLCDHVPVSVPGIMFLSGGMCEEEATRNLNEINKIWKERVDRTRMGRSPWTISFSFGRALQTSAVKAWAGRDANVAKGQSAFLIRCKANAEAQFGVYTGWAIKDNDAQIMQQKGYVLRSRL